MRFIIYLAALITMLSTTGCIFPGGGGGGGHDDHHDEHHDEHHDDDHH
jgi:hypothetical protein